MSDAIAASRDLLTGIPLKVRRTLYGLFGLVILLDGIWNVLPDDIATPLVTTFGVLGSILALANTTPTPLPPPPPPVVEAYPGEFP